MGHCKLVSLAIILSILSGGCVGSSGKVDDDTSYCESWKFTAENKDAGKWSVVPRRCKEFMKNYMTGGRYLSDSKFVADNSISFAKNVTLAGDGLDCWIFDVDETLFSNLRYFKDYGYGTEVNNITAAYEYVKQGEIPALPESLRLYNQLLHLNFTIFVLTGRAETYRNVTVKNLHFAGYTNWKRLILRGASDVDEGENALVYKSKKRRELEAEGYRIQGNTGDQWSDLLGNAAAVRSFKLPNPMYYVE